MRWTILSKSPRQEVYELWHLDKKLMTLEYHPFTNSARIESSDEKRVFLIRKEGFLRNKTVLRDEYGMRIGQLGYEKSNLNNGTIELNEEKFSYSINTDNLPELKIFKENEEKPFVICAIKTDRENTLFDVNNEHEQLTASEHFMLMSLCWYMFLPVAQKSIPEFAS
jgi:hypothetical protein